MIAKIKHHGPDDEGKTHVPNQANLVRGVIIDIKNGQQPMRSDDKRYTLVFNGEIYNYVELKELLIKEEFYCKFI